MRYECLLMNHGLPKISMFRSWGRLQAHTHIFSHHRHQYIRTLYRASPVNLQHGDTAHWLLASRESSDLHAQRELLLLHLRSRQCNGRCEISSRLEAVTAGGHDCNALASCQYDENKISYWVEPSIFPRGQFSLSTFHVQAIVMNTTAICHVYRYDIGIRSSKFVSNFPASHADVRKHYDMLYGKESYPSTLNASLHLLVQQIDNFITMKDWNNNTGQQNKFWFLSQVIKQVNPTGFFLRWVQICC